VANLAYAAQEKTLFKWAKKQAMRVDDAADNKDSMIEQLRIFSRP
jgi:hypothetical protein